MLFYQQKVSKGNSYIQMRFVTMTTILTDIVIFQPISMIWMSGSVYHQFQQNQNFSRGLVFLLPLAPPPPQVW